MALELSILVAGIESAFTSGLDGADVDTVVEELTAKIVLYSSGAEILMLPGPIQIPGSPPVPSTGQGATLKVTTIFPNSCNCISLCNNQFSTLFGFAYLSLYVLPDTPI